MTAAPKIQQIDRDEIDQSESFEARKERVRIRLTADEQRTINYVLCGWDSEVGLGSNFGAMAQALASKDDPGMHCVEHSNPPNLDDGDTEKEIVKFEESRSKCKMCATKRRAREKWLSSQKCQEHKDRPTEHGERGAYDKAVAACAACASGAQVSAQPVKGPSKSKDIDRAHAIERWCDQPVAVRNKILRAWRAIRLMAVARSPSLVILTAACGDMPPGLPAPGIWDTGRDLEYRRVVRYAEGSGGSGAALDAILHVDRHKRPSESQEAFKARVVDAECARRAVIVELGAACERLLARATEDYRAAWEAAK